MLSVRFANFNNVNLKVLQNIRTRSIPNASWQGPLRKIAERIVNPIALRQVPVDSGMKIEALKLQGEINQRMFDLPNKRPFSDKEIIEINLEEEGVEVEAQVGGPPGPAPSRSEADQDKTTIGDTKTFKKLDAHAQAQAEQDHLSLLNQALTAANKRVAELNRKLDEADAGHKNALSALKGQERLLASLTDSLKYTDTKLKKIEDEFAKQQGIKPLEQRLKENKKLRDLKKELASLREDLQAIKNPKLQASANQQISETAENIKRIETQIKTGHQNEFKEKLASDDTYKFHINEKNNKTKLLQDQRVTASRARLGVKREENKVQAIHEEIQRLLAFLNIGIEKFQQAADSIEEKLEGTTAGREKPAESASVEKSLASGLSAQEKQEKAERLGELAGKGDQAAAAELIEFMRKNK